MLNDKLMYKFLNRVKREKLMTLFLTNILFDNGLNDYNYICRLFKKDGLVVLDIYDNISKNRFNRYLFDFNNTDYDYKREEIDNVFVNYLGINNLQDSSLNLIKLGFLFKLPKDKMIEYSSLFLDEKINNILIDIINRPI